MHFNAASGRDDVYRHCRGCCRLPRRIPRHRAQRVIGECIRGRIPVAGVGRTCVFRAKIRSIEFELHANHTHVVAGLCGDRDDALHCVSILRIGNVDGGRRGIGIIDNHVPRRLGGIARSVDGYRFYRMRCVGRLGGNPGNAVG